MTARIAPLALEDLDDARALAVLADVAIGSRDQWERDLRRSSALLLGAWLDDHLVGVATGAIAVDAGEVHLVAVDPAVRRHGVGSALTRALCTAMAVTGVERVLLEVRAGNEPARALYAAIGFEEVARRRSYYSDGDDALVLALATAGADVPVSVPTDGRP